MASTVLNLLKSKYIIFSQTVFKPIKEKRWIVAGVWLILRKKVNAFRNGMSEANGMEKGIWPFVFEKSMRSVTTLLSLTIIVKKQKCSSCINFNRNPLIILRFSQFALIVFFFIIFDV